MWNVKFVELWTWSQKSHGPFVSQPIYQNWCESVMLKNRTGPTIERQLKKFPDKFALWIEPEAFRFNKLMRIQFTAPYNWNDLPCVFQCVL